MGRSLEGQRMCPDSACAAACKKQGIRAATWGLDNFAGGCIGTANMTDVDHWEKQKYRCVPPDEANTMDGL